MDLEEGVSIPLKSFRHQHHVGGRLDRRGSTHIKVSNAKRYYLSVAKIRFLILLCCCACLIGFFGGKEIVEAIQASINRLWIKVPRAGQVPYPSINLFHYEKRYSFPVFSDSYPSGLERKVMPQFPERIGGKNTSQQVWTTFHGKVVANGGNFKEEVVDLRFTNPLQSELSGYVVFNVLFGDNGEKMRQRLDENHQYFSEHIILLRTPEDLVGKSGERIPSGTLFNLDGHHTNEALKLCAKTQHPSLRHGALRTGTHICGKTFDTKQSVLIIEDVHPLRVIELAIESGAGNGYGMIPV